MKQIQTYLTVESYLNSIKDGDHSTPNVSVVGDLGEEQYFYDGTAATPQSNPEFFSIVAAAGWNVNNQNSVSKKELSFVHAGDLIKAMNGNTALTSFNEFRYFTGVEIITKNMFSGCTSIEEITIPKSIKLIENGSFDFFPSGVKIKYEGNRSNIIFTEDASFLATFYDSGITTNHRIVGFNGNITSLRNAFEYIVISGENNNNVIINTSDITGYTISQISGLVEESLIYVNYYPKSLETSSFTWAFYNLQTMHSLSIPNILTGIPDNFVLQCYGLETIYFGNKIKSIGNYAFKACTGLTSIDIPNGITVLGSEAFSGCSSLINILVPDSVTTIGPRCFGGCGSLTSITLSNSINKIPDYCFLSCIRLRNITIPESVEAIGYQSFSYCRLIDQINIPNSVSAVSDYAFSGCDGVTEIIIGTGLHVICGSTFSGIKLFENNFINNSSCSSETHWGATFYDPGVTKNGPLYFSGSNNEYLIRCERSISSVTVPNGVTHISASAFSYCQANLITIGPDVVSIGNYAFSYSEIESVSLPNGVTGLGQYCFSSCHRLTSATLPDTVTSAGSNTFSYCISLTEMPVMRGISRIPDSYVSYCISITSATITNNITSLGDSIFSNCSALTLISATECETSTPAISYYTFYNVPRNGTLKIGRDCHTGWLDDGYPRLGYYGWKLYRV